MTEDPPLLELRGVSKVFGAVQALNRVNLSVPAGKITALVGDNGAGKSVTIKTISGLWHANGGRHPLGGQASPHPQPERRRSARDHDHLPGPRAVRQPRHRAEHVPRAREAAPPAPRRDVHGDSRRAKILADLHVTTVRSIRQPVASLSGGQRQSVAVAKAVMSGGQARDHGRADRRARGGPDGQVLELIKRLSSQGTAVLVISHNLNDVFDVADQISVLYLGRMVAQGPAVGIRPPGRRRVHDNGRVASGRGMTDTIDEPVAPGESPGGQTRRRRLGNGGALGADELVVLAPDVLARLPGRLPAGLVEAHPRRRERRPPHHRRPDRHLHLLRGAVERVPDGDQHRQPLRPGDVHHPPRNGRAVRPDPQRDRPLRRLRGRGRRRHRHGPDRRPQNWVWWAGLIVGLVACAAHRCLPGHHHHQAQDPVVRRHPGRACWAGRAS